jgi:hypothetical protein
MLLEEQLAQPKVPQTFTEALRLALHTQEIPRCADIYIAPQHHFCDLDLVLKKPDLLTLMCSLEPLRNRVSAASAKKLNRVKSTTATTE